MSKDNEVLYCGHLPSPHDEHTTGYGEELDGKKYCWMCCAEMEKEIMRKEGKITLYFVRDKLGGKVTNWTGYLSWPCKIKVGKHNIAGNRYDVWFKVGGETWHGVQYGENTQICHCKKIKGE